MIDFQKHYNQIVHFFSDNPLISFAVCVVIIFFLYKKTEAAVKFLAFCALLITVIYIMSLLSDSGSFGVDRKKVMTQKSEEVIKSSPQ